MQRVMARKEIESRDDATSSPTCICPCKTRCRRSQSPAPAQANSENPSTDCKAHARIMRSVARRSAALARLNAHVPALRARRFDLPNPGRSSSSSAFKGRCRAPLRTIPLRGGREVVCSRALRRAKAPARARHTDEFGRKIKRVAITIATCNTATTPCSFRRSKRARPRSHPRPLRVIRIAPGAYYEPAQWQQLDVPEQIAAQIEMTRCPSCC